MTEWKAFTVDTSDRVATVTLIGPGKGNAMGPDFWDELPVIFGQLDADPEVLAVVLAVQVAIVHVVNVILMWNGNVTAVWAVLVGVLFVDCVSHFSDILSASFSVHFH